MFNRILVTIDGSFHADKAAGIAGDLASKHGSDVVLLHVIDPSNLSEEDERMAEVEHVGTRGHEQYPWVANVPAELGAMLQPDDSTVQREKMLEFLAEKIVRASMGRLVEQGVDKDRVRVVFKNGKAVKRILETIEEEQIDCVVMGSRGLSDVKGALEGSVSHRVSHHADCTVVTVK